MDPFACRVRVDCSCPMLAYRQEGDRYILSHVWYRRIPGKTFPPLWTPGHGPAGAVGGFTALCEEPCLVLYGGMCAGDDASSEEVLLFTASYRSWRWRRVHPLVQELLQDCHVVHPSEHEGHVCFGREDVPPDRHVLHAFSTLTVYTEVPAERVLCPSDGYSVSVREILGALASEARVRARGRRGARPLFPALVGRTMALGDHSNVPCRQFLVPVYLVRHGVHSLQGFIRDMLRYQKQKSLVLALGTDTGRFFKASEATWEGH